jgi:hypothetical protein
MPNSRDDHLHSVGHLHPGYPTSNHIRYEIKVQLIPRIDF